MSLMRLSESLRAIVNVKSFEIEWTKSRKELNSPTLISSNLYC